MTVQVGTTSIRTFGWAEVGIAGLLMLFSFYLMASPLMPDPNDSHGGMLALFSGLFLFPVATSLMVAGAALIRAHRWRWWAQSLPFATCAAIVLFLSR